MPSPPNETMVNAYFARLAAPLAPLPADVRDAQLRELHQHLAALVSAREAQGLSPEDATASALAQMGDPTQVGRNLCREWKRSRRDPFWSTVIAIGLTQFILYTFMTERLMWLFQSQGTHGMFSRQSSFLFTDLLAMWYVLVSVLGGIFVGRRLLERAVAGAFFVGLVASASSMSLIVYSDIHNHVWAVPGLSVSGYEILAAYVVSSLKRRDWKFQLK